jgi:23S rRNA-intervening sequence protein
VDTGNRKVQKQDFLKRTMEFGLRVVHLVETLPKTQTGQVFGRQLLRRGTSVGANYRSAVRGKSDPSGHRQFDQNCARSQITFRSLADSFPVSGIRNPK